MSQYPSNIDLSSLTGANGFKISGESSGDQSGYSVASAGDINGDGFADLIIGAPVARPHGDYSGASYVVFGKASGFATNLDLSALTGSNGFKISGTTASDFSGFSVASAGDFNGDGFADLIIGAPEADPHGDYSGASYVVFGKASGFVANLDLASLTGSNGFRLSGVDARDRSGTSVATAGDVNGDGFADLIIGALRVDAPDDYSGAAYVVFGSASGFAANFDLSSLTGTNGFKLSGVASKDYTGQSVASAGDVNGDGFADLIVGARGADPHGYYYSGASYVVFGKASGFAADLDLSSLTGTNGFRISGVYSEDRSGYSVASAGDVNGDGFADLIIGAWDADPNLNSSGASYVVFGKTSGFGANLDLSSLTGTNGFKISGAATFDRSGRPVASAGDVNGDGFADLIIGAEGADPHGGGSGASYVVFGKASAFSANLDVTSLTGVNGFQLSGVEANSESGSAAASAGDVNGDGLADLIIGARRASPHGVYSGASYVVFGRMADAAVNLTGTAASQTLIGSNFNDTLSGLEGDDSLSGFNGFDTLSGGAGNDTLDGGASYDTASYSTDAAGINANLLTGIATGAAIGADVLVNIENLTGGAGNDTITGDNKDNTLTGNGGNNIFDGKGGHDSIVGSSGVDTALFTGAIADYTFFHHPQGGSAFGVVDNRPGSPDGADNLFSVELLQFSDGSVNSNQIINTIGFAAPYFLSVGHTDGDALSAKDNLVGPWTRYWILALGGDDTISGLRGGDFVDAGDGNDSVVADWGNETIFGGSGNDTISAYHGNVSGGGFFGGVFLIDGGAGDDFFAGVSYNNTDFGGPAEADTLTGGSGSDIYQLLADASLPGVPDTIVDFQTGAGGDIIDISHGVPNGINPFLGGYARPLQSGSDVLIQLDADGDGSAYGWTTALILQNANATGLRSNNFASPFNYDPLQLGGLVGDDEANTIAGSPYNDTLTGNGGNDSISALTGTDFISGGAGNDTLDGGMGIDTAVFSGARAAYTITLGANNSATVTGSDGTDTLFNVEKAAFSDKTIFIRPPVNDLDGDGKSDFLFQQDNFQPSAWLMDGSTVASGGYIHYVNLTPTDPGPGWHVKGSGDFNSDGNADIIWQEDNGMPAIWLTNGLQLSSGGYVHFIDLSPTNPGSNWHIMGSGDFNSDGNADLLWQDDTGMPAIWLINGFQLTSGGYIHYPDLSPASPGPTWHVKGAADFNGDGNADVLWQDDLGNPAIWLVNGFALSSGGYIHNPDLSPANLGAGWHIKGAGDFDGDGKADVVWQHDDGRAAIWLIDGFALRSSTIMATNPGTDWDVIGAGDYNGDGKADIQWQNDNGQPMIWLMDGVNVLSAADAGANPGPTWHLDWV